MWHFQFGAICRMISFHVQMTEGQLKLRKRKKRSMRVCVMALKTVFALYFNTFSRAGAWPRLYGGCTLSARSCARGRMGLTCLTFVFLSRDVCNWGISKRLSRFLLHPPLSHSQGNNAAADTGRHCVWLEDIQALSGETFRMDKKPEDRKSVV